MTNPWTPIEPDPAVWLKYVGAMITEVPQYICTEDDFVLLWSGTPRPDWDEIPTPPNPWG